ncbi:hypothetical protein [Nonomuraea sp. NPDC050786]|uniref:hypothetical protein n=1 Tax=Nonomuraea sp. NPDC050786 TaxID=3154840 RepID=UPI0033FB011A
MDMPKLRDASPTPTRQRTASSTTIPTASVYLSGPSAPPVAAANTADDSAIWAGGTLGAILIAIAVVSWVIHRRNKRDEATFVDGSANE